MSRYAFIYQAACVEVRGAFVSPHTGQQYGADWIEKSTLEDRAAIQLLDVVDALAPAPGRRIVSTEIRPIGGVPTEVHTLEDIPLADRKAAMLLAVDVERDRRQQLDFFYDFGETPAVNPAKEQAPAGVKALQMRVEPDQRNWLGLQSQAVVAVMMQQPDAPAPMRAEDNFNILTTAAQVLVVTAAMVARNGSILFYGGDLKDEIRAATTAEQLDAINIEIGWPS